MANAKSNASPSESTTKSTGKTKPGQKVGVWQVGQCYFVRTVTYHSVGRLIYVDGHELVLENASWVADSGRWGNALATGILGEVEPFTDPVIIGRNAIVDATVWRHNLPTETLPD